MAYQACLSTDELAQGIQAQGKSLLTSCAHTRPIITITTLVCLFLMDCTSLVLS